MLVADELREGNWIKDKTIGHVIYVQEKNIGDIIKNIDQYEGFELTNHEFIKHVGFTQHFGLWKREIKFHYKKFLFEWKAKLKSHNGWYLQDDKLKPQPLYTHELQNYFFKRFEEEFTDYANRTRYDDDQKAPGSWHDKYS